MFVAIWLAAATGQAQPLLASGPQAGAQIPTLGDTSELGSSAERRIGDRIAFELYRDPDYIDDPVLVDYVQGIWQPLLAAARARGDLSPELAERFAWQFMLGHDRTVNAFALPGGYLGINLGLIAVVSSRDELASVLGHELSHVTQRHISRLIAKEGKQTPLLIGAMILGALAASRNPDAGSALMVGGQAVAAQNQLNFSRDMEREADRVGFGIMAQAGFDGRGFVSMFEKLENSSRLNDNGAFPYLRSHPLTTERIADMQARQALSAPASTPAAQVTPEHAMIAARARVLSNPGVDDLRSLLAQVNAGDLAANQAGVLYGAALAASQLRDFSNARAYQARLNALPGLDRAARRLILLLDAETALAEGDAARAEPALSAIAASQTGADAGDARPELFLQAQFALQQSQAGLAGARAAVTEVAQRLQLWVVVHPTDSQAWQWLSSCSVALGQSLRALRADAEAQVARLDYPAALYRFKAAQELVRAQHGGTAADHIDASIIDTRQREVQALMKEQLLDR